MGFFGEELPVNRKEYKRLVGLIKKNPKLYMGTIINALADSPISTRDFLFWYCLKLGFESRDYRKKVVEESNERRMYVLSIIELWEESPNNHFTVDDIPKWVREKLVYKGAGAKRDRIPDILKELSVQQHWKPRRFVKLNDTYHFTKAGYNQVVEYAVEHNLITKEDAEKWRQEYDR